MLDARLARYLPAVVLGVGCVLVGTGVRSQERVQPAAPLTSIPASFGDYTGSDQTIADEERRVAGMSDYVMRTFRRDSTDAFSVYVGYYDYQVQGKTIHSPRNCLPGAGWEALESGVKPISVGGRRYLVNRYLLANGPAQALVYYWYQGRGRVEANEYRVKWNLLRDAALRGRTEESLVRIVVPVTPPAAGQVAPPLARPDSIAAAVAQRLIPEVSRVMPSVGA